MILYILIGHRLSGKSTWAEDLMNKASDGTDFYRVGYMELCKHLTGISHFVPKLYDRMYKSILDSAIISCMTNDRNLILDGIPLDINLLEDCVNHADSATIYMFEVSAAETFSRNKNLPSEDKLDVHAIRDNRREVERFIRSDRFIDFLSKSNIDVRYVNNNVEAQPA